MLFTRCPACHTTFRITAEILRIANGKVRCGSCASVFSAYSGLRQETGFRPTPEEDVFSQTMQARELAALEELEEPADAASDPSSGGGRAKAVEEPLQAEAAARLAERETGTEAAAEEAVEHDAPTQAAVEESTAHDVPAAAPADEVAEPDLAAESLGEAMATSETDQPLTFEQAGEDDWSQVFEEIASGTDEADDDATGDDVGTSEPEEAEPVEIDSGEILEFGTGLGADFDPDGLWSLGHENVTELADFPDGGADPTADHAASQVAMDVPELEAPRMDVSATTGAQVEYEIELGKDDLISAEEVDATLSAEPAPELLAALTGESRTTRMPLAGVRVWSLGSAFLTLLLVAQIVHSYRAPLASQSLVGPVLRFTYSALGMELFPRWDLTQYEILDLAATGGSGASEVSNLRITAQIRNNGPRAQPYPSILLELKDRWEAVVGSRVFDPGEYLPHDAVRADAMAAGATVPAELAIVDPGNDAYGFELDICVPAEAARLRCAADQVFK